MINLVFLTIIVIQQELVQWLKGYQTTNLKRILKKQWEKRDDEKIEGIKNLL